MNLFTYGLYSLYTCRDCGSSLEVEQRMHAFQGYFSRTLNFNFQDFPGPGIFKKKIQEAWKPCVNDCNVRQFPWKSASEWDHVSPIACRATDNIWNRNVVSVLPSVMTEMLSLISYGLTPTAYCLDSNWKRSVCVIKFLSDTSQSCLLTADCPPCSTDV